MDEIVNKAAEDWRDVYTDPGLQQEDSKIIEKRVAQSRWNVGWFSALLFASISALYEYARSKRKIK